MYPKLRDEIIERIDLLFIWEADCEMFPVTNSADENARRFIHELDEYGLVMITPLFTKGEFTRGMTVCDARDKPAVPFSPAVEQVIAPFQEPNVEVAVGINREKFLELAIAVLALFGSI